MLDHDRPGLASLSFGSSYTSKHSFVKAILIKRMGQQGVVIKFYAIQV